MTNSALVLVGSLAITLWGLAHIVPTRSVVAGFGAISETNQRIIMMEWVAEGLTLCFIGLLVLSTSLFGGAGAASLLVYRASALMLLIMAGWTSLTGARTPIVPIKLCPAVKTIVAILFIVASSI